MHLSLIPLAWLATANAMPTTQQQREEPAAAADPAARRSFTLPVSVNPDYVPNGPAELAAAYRKWNIPVPEGLDGHLLTRRGGYSSATAQATSTNGDSYWLTNIFVGTPEAQVIPIMIDSASSNFWLMSTDTQFGDAAKNGKHKVYDPSRSEVSQEIPGVSWKSEYNDGSALSGKVYFDTVRLGLSTDQHWTKISNATIQSAVTVSNRFAVDPNLSGVMGLAKRGASDIQPRMPSFFDRLKNEMHFPWVDADLRSNSSLGFWSFGSSLHGGGSTLIDEPPMPESEHWDVRIPRVRMTSMGDTEWLMYGFTATIDTGTSLMLLPPKIVARYYAEIPESSFDATLDSYLFPCSAASGIPDLNFMTSGKYIGTVSKENINHGPVPGMNDKCYGGIQKSGSENRAIFGGVVLKTLYVRFNFGEKGDFVSFGKKGSDVCFATSVCNDTE